TTSSFVVAGFPSPTTAGTAQSFTVTAVDAYGNRTPGFLSPVRFTSTDSSATLPATYTFTSADQGQHTFTATLRTAGTRSITATYAGTGASFSGTQSGITVTPAATARFSIQGPGDIVA